MPTKSSDVYREIQAILGSYSWGIPTSSLSCLEIGYLQEFGRSLDYNSLGVNNSEELFDKMHDKGMVLFLPERNKTYVMCARTVKTRQKVVKRNVQELLDEYGGEIPLMHFEVLYKDKFKGKLDYHFFGLKDLDSLCKVLNLVVEAANSPGEKVIKAGKIYSSRNMSNTNMSTQSSVVYHEIQKIIGSYFFGLSVLHLSCVKTIYQLKFKRSLDYEFLGVKDIEELIGEMHDKGLVLFYENPESKKTCVMSVRNVEFSREILKRNVEELLDKYDGEIPLGSFEGIYKDKFKVKLNYHLCGLKDLDHLCKVLNLVVDAANSGEEVMKSGKIYNLRKRKK